MSKLGTTEISIFGVCVFLLLFIIHFVHRNKIILFSNAVASQTNRWCHYDYVHLLFSQCTIFILKPLYRFQLQEMKRFNFFNLHYTVSTLAIKHLIHEKRVANIIASKISCTLPAPSLSLAHINGTQTLLKKCSEKFGWKGKMFATRRTFFQFVFLTKSNSGRNSFYIIKK